MKNKNILIIGGTGFIGYHLIKKCLKKKFNITCVSTSRPIKKNYFFNVKYIICDIRNKKKLKKKINGKYNFVINLAGYVNHSKFKKTFTSHYNGCVNVANIFKKKNIEHFVQIGSSLEYGKKTCPQKEDIKCNPVSNYGLAKFKSSQYLLNLFETYNFPCTIIRLYQAYGPNQKNNRLIPFVINSCIRNKKFPCTDGIQKRDFLYIDDLIDLIFKIIRSKKTKGEIINAGSGRPIKIKNLIKLIKKYSKGGNPNFGQIKMRKDEILNLYPSINKARQLLNWKPKVSIKDGLRKTINYYRESL